MSEPTMRRTPLGLALSALGRPAFVMGIVLAMELLIFSLLEPNFRDAQNLENILVQSVTIMLIAVGLTFVMVSGHIDLSAGTVLGFTAGLSLYLQLEGLAGGTAIVVALVVGAALGLFNGIFVAIFKINDFIVTLGTLALAAGLLRLLDSFRSLRGGESEFFADLADGELFGLPMPVIITAVVAVAAETVLRRTAFGRRVFCVGANRDAAYFSGIRVSRVEIGVFVISGVMAALSGVLLASRLGSVQAGLGGGFEIEAIAAAVLGGTALAGGSGSVTGTVIGALILATLRNGLQFLGVDPAWFQIITGLVILLSIIANRYWALALNRVQTRRPTTRPEGVEPEAALSGEPSPLTIASVGGRSGK